MSGASTGWREIGRETFVETPYLTVARETVATPSRPAGVDWMVAHRRQAVVVAPRTPDGRYLLVHQERIPARETLWEFPAGQIEGEVTPESITATAHRELGEETGHRIGGELISLGDFLTSAGFTDERCHLFLATDVVPRDEGHLHDDGEAILECRAVALDELREMIAAGKIHDANTLAAFARLSATGRLVAAAS